MEKYKVAEITNIKKVDNNIILTLDVDADLMMKKETIEVTLLADGVNFNIGDLVKFESENASNLQKVPTDNMDYTEYYSLQKRIAKLSYEELIETHKKIEGKIGKSEIYGEYNFYQKYVEDILNFNRYKATAIEVPEEISKFINSEYLSNYLKKTILSKINTYKQDEKDNERFFNSVEEAIAINALTSNRNFSDFSEYEFNSIYIILQQLKDKNGEKDYFYNQILSLAFHLDSEGAKSFINNKVDPIIVIKRIITTSGLNDRPSYYSGRGAKLCDLNGTHLVSIFKKLARLDKRKAFAMVQMVYQMPTLGATEFLNSLYSLVYNNYDLEKTDLHEDNFDLGNGSDDSRFAIGMATISSFMGLRTDDTEAIKKHFSSMLSNELGELKLSKREENIDSYYHRYK